MTKIRLKYINSYRDRHRKLRYYFRKAGFKKVALPGCPGSAEFMAAYQSALASATPSVTDIGAKRTKPGTIDAAGCCLLHTRRFRELQPSTQRDRRGILERFRAQHGDVPFA